MARWRLLNAHYLNVKGNEWEYKETSRETGKQVRKVFDVPMYLDPRDSADHNYPNDIIVCHGQGQGRDIVFTGPPTPDMEPLDDEAQAISDAERPKWQKPGEMIPGQSYSESLLGSLVKQVDALVQDSEAKAAPPVSTNGIDPAKFVEMQTQLTQLMEMNARLQAQMAEKPRRI